MDQVEPEGDIQMRPGMKCLLNLLRGQIVDLTLDKQELDQALALAEEEHILPWAAHQCRHQASIPLDLSDRLKAIERDAAVAAFYWSSQLKNLLFAFEQRGIVVVPLKGPFLAQRLFGDAALRVSYDLDLLVSKGDVIRAEAILLGLGFIADTPDDYHRQWIRGGTTVELHYDVENPLAFNFHTAQVLQRVQPAVFQGQRCWQLAPDDELLFLCLHGVRHMFGRMSLVLDLCLAFEKLDISATNPTGPQMAERSSLLTLGLAMARRVKPEIGTTLLSELSVPHQRHLDSLADRLWDRLLSQSSGSLDWRTIHRFYLEIEPSGQRLAGRIRHLRILLSRVIRSDYEFAAQFGLSRVWQVRMLRPLRLVRDVIRPRTSL